MCYAELPRPSVNSLQVSYTYGLTVDTVILDFIILESHTIIDTNSTMISPRKYAFFSIQFAVDAPLGTAAQ